jgi:hypothetical protein
LNELKKHPCAEPFLTTTDEDKYNKKIKDPMDLSIVEKKLKSGDYISVIQFAEDIRKIWLNSWMSNYPGSSSYIATTEIGNFFENLLKEISEASFNPNEIQEPKKQIYKEPNRTKKNAGVTQQKNSMEKPMTIQEKAMLKINIMKLAPDKIQGILDIVKDIVEMNQPGGTLEFDIEVLPPLYCRKLEQYVKKNVPNSLKSGKPKKPTRKSDSKSNKAPLLDQASDIKQLTQESPIQTTSIPSATVTQKPTAIENRCNSVEEESEGNS